MKTPDLLVAGDRKKVNIKEKKLNLNIKPLYKGKKYFLRTYGCQMNVHDSEEIKYYLEALGYEAVEELAAITGQAPVVTKAKKSIANFKLREGMPIGCKVTLRKEKMYEFLDKLFNISLPRVRDFRGVSDTSFDGRGNYTLGIKEQIIFPEIDFDKVDRTRGMDIVIVTSAKTNEEAKALLTQMGMPFKK